MPELFHRKLERSAMGFVIAIIAAASVGGIEERAIVGLRAENGNSHGQPSYPKSHDSLA